MKEEGVLVPTSLQPLHVSMDLHLSSDTLDEDGKIEICQDLVFTLQSVCDGRLRFLSLHLSQFLHEFVTGGLLYGWTHLGLNFSIVGKSMLNRE